MESTKPNAKQFLNQLMRHRYNALIKQIVEKFKVDKDKAERLQNLITYEFIEDALRKEDS